MQTIQFNVHDSYLQVVVSILKNLKQGIIKDLSITNNNKKNIDIDKEKIDNFDTFFDKFQIDMSDYRFDREEANAR